MGGEVTKKKGTKAEKKNEKKKKEGEEEDGEEGEGEETDRKRIYVFGGREKKLFFLKGFHFFSPSVFIYEKKGFFSCVFILSNSSQIQGTLLDTVFLSIRLYLILALSI